MTLEDAIAIKLAFQSYYFHAPRVTTTVEPVIHEAERIICARARQITGLDFPARADMYPGTIRLTPGRIHVVPGQFFDYPESKGKLP